jgi:LPXTG-site transpeptidase (sortase) family protein
VGVPKADGAWDVSWLDQSAGYLEDTAFPTLPGNTVITAHVWDADGSAGIFARLDELEYGERFSIRSGGQTYTYEVRGNELYLPASSQPLQHDEDYDWVTLITCEGFDEASGQYRYRRAVRAVLVSVD